MPRKARELSPLEVRRLTKPGRWSVGGVDGLALQVAASGARSWVLRIYVTGTQREMGLGSFPSTSLAQAREKARQHRDAQSRGLDPISARRAALSAAAAKRASQRTFSEVASQYIAQHESSWKNKKHGAQWTSTLQTYVEPLIGSLLVSDVTSAHVIKVLEPIWTTKTETATRIRSRVELVLDFAAARGLRESGHLTASLQAPTECVSARVNAAVGIADEAASEPIRQGNKAS